MAAEVSRKKKSRFACKCLNVQIKASKPVGPVPAELASEPGFTQVYVKHDGISAAHPQLTLRIRSRGTPIEGSSRFAQFMSLGCLVCRTLVYRAFISAPLQTNSHANLATREGPVIPKSGWVEDDVLRTPSGWIEVFEGALTEADISQQEESPQYSSLFSLVLPPIAAPPFPKSPTLSTPEPTELHYLAALEPMYPSTPATSDPVFLRLSNIAAIQSEKLRLKAEQEVDEIVKVKIAQLLQAEDELKAQVQALVDTYREGLRVAEEEGNPKSPTLRSWKETSSGDSNGATVSVRDFVPVQVPATSPSRSPPAPRVSTLSASLATSSFHHPRAIKEQAPHDGRPSSIASSVTLTSEKSHLHEEGSTVLQFRRNLDDGLNTAASYRYFVNLEDEMARHRKESGKQPEEKPRSASGSAQAAPSEPEAPQSTPSSKGKERESPSSGERPPSLKPKRKVTFDVQSEERSSTGDSPQSRIDSDMVFDLEEEEGGERPVEVRPVLPLIEQTAPTRPNRPRSHRQQPEIASSLSSFRPLSLLSSPHRGSPNGLSSSPLASSVTSRVERPSPLRMAMSLPDEDPSIARVSPGSPRRSAQSPRKLSEIREVPHDKGIDIARPSTIEGSLQEQMDDHQQRHDEEIMRLLAAGTPSHRAAWSNGGKAWGQFLHRGRERMFDSDALAEDDYEVDKRREHINEHYEEVLDSTRNGVPGSLPVRIKPLVKQREVLSLASYKPQMIGARE
ncbi:uncharacterized protein EV420DRAFT_124540 [Desarmillaria tabescens]|uniref:Uncharacterized protein n=1 Tax=Armillaria tabescens TaxID=1929756 RepID=A0AA39N9U7_ARMTA|nr:uncharacterized protein EV420DRAFT_124540 [Desarmillaria tabescens]KAK0461710.1 hypothetical protein EV420DRAFT_124540 [Desarmillaria tabescens]